MKNIDKYKNEILETMERNDRIEVDYMTGLDCFLNSLRTKDGKCRYFNCYDCFMKSLEWLAKNVKEKEE